MTQAFVHNGMKIEIDEAVPSQMTAVAGAPAPAAAAAAAAAAAPRPTVTIDGERIPVLVDPGSKKVIAARHSPHMTFESLKDLAIHVADHVIAQRAPGEKK